MIFGIITSIALLVSIVAIVVLSRRNPAADIEELTRRQLKSYEESSARILAETRRQYEHQISILEQRLERQAAELKRTSAIEFENLANEVLERQTSRLSVGNRRELSAILDPLKENIGDFRRAVDDSYLKENSSREALRRQVEQLVRANSEIGEETRRLSDALRGNTRLQGRWGEQILERLLDSAGFIRDVHYSTQVTKSDGRRLVDDDGKAQRPDLLFILPGDSRVVIDAKTSMTAYLSYCEAASEAEEQSSLKAHVDSVRRHVDELSRAQYHKYISGALEHTLMFMPNDGAFLAALRGDPSLPEYALKRNVVIVSPTHLLSILQLINQLWRVDKQNRNAEEIAALGGKLYDKFASFVADFEAIRRNLDSTANAYERCRRHIAEGNTSLAARAEKLRAMGARTTKTIPASYIDFTQSADDSVAGHDTFPNDRSQQCRL